MKVGIIDYGVGNIGSVYKAIQELSYAPILVDRASSLSDVGCIILPGVGSFADCKKILDDNGWTVALHEEVLIKGKPILGICLGMQLLADKGFEGGMNSEGTLGLGFIPGVVKSLSNLECSLRLPHIGWNSIRLFYECELLEGILNETDFYFVHKYAFVPHYKENLVAVTNYDIDIAAVVNRNNIWGTQFHPEKSSKPGLKVLKNFLDISLC